MTWKGKAGILALEVDRRKLKCQAPIGAAPIDTSGLPMPVCPHPALAPAVVAEHRSFLLSRAGRGGTRTFRIRPSTAGAAKWAKGMCGREDANGVRAEALLRTLAGCSAFPATECSAQGPREGRQEHCGCPTGGHGVCSVLSGPVYVSISPYSHVAATPGHGHGSAAPARA